MAPEGDDPAVVRSLAVTADDAIAAIETRRQRGKRVVLRATPPYSGRMRARLHVPAEDSTPESVTIDPVALLDPDAPTYPRPAETEDELRADRDAEYAIERHHDRHEQAIATWREQVRDHFVDETTIETTDGKQTVDLVVLGE